MGKVYAEGHAFESGGLKAYFGADAAGSDPDMNCTSDTCANEGSLSSEEVRDAVQKFERALNGAPGQSPSAGGVTESRITLHLEEEFRERESTWEVAGLYRTHAKIDVTASWQNGQWKIFCDPSKLEVLDRSTIIPSLALDDVKTAAGDLVSGIGNFFKRIPDEVASVYSSVRASLSQFFSPSQPVVSDNTRSLEVHHRALIMR